MCGIVGYTGKEEAQTILLNAMARLEYRGYDSSGIAVLNGSIKVYKDKIRVEQLKKISPRLDGNSGIGHTRWATHGEPCQVNAHPHCDCHGRIAVVHNGVISNHQSLKDQLIWEGHRFLSETDTEVVAHLIEKYYRGDIEKATRAALEVLEGSYAIAVLAADQDKLIVAKDGNPLVIGMGEEEKIVASDIPALLEVTNRVIFLEDGDLAAISPDEVVISNHGKRVSRDIRSVPWSAQDRQKQGHEHFMLKEIHEQPRVIRDTIAGFESGGLGDVEMVLNKKDNNLLILACGTSYHAGLIGQYIIEELLDLSVRVEIASEVNHRDHVVRFPNVLAISQSGETADVITAVRKMKKTGSFTSGITNVQGSSLSRLVDRLILTAAGPEVSVAATKTFIAQLIAFYQLVLQHPEVDRKIQKKLSVELRLLPNQVQRLLDNVRQISDCAVFLSDFSNAFFIGRGINYPVALEGALKLKEISYIHAEGYPAGELKHGPFSLLTDQTPVVAVVAPDKTYDCMLANIQEIKARKAPLIAIISEKDRTTENLADLVIRVPATVGLFSPVVNSVALQLLAYFAATERACPVDFPRNLAKSVTVE